MFEALVNAIACQQLSLEVGIQLLNRLTTSWGRPVGSDPDALLAFPTPRALASADPAELSRIGFSSVKARTIIDTARMVADRTLDLEALAELDDRAAVELLTSLRGIGALDHRVRDATRARSSARLPGRRRRGAEQARAVSGYPRRLDYEGVRDLLARWQPYASVAYSYLLLDSLSEAGVIPAELATRSYPRRRSPDPRRASRRSPSAGSRT